MALPTIDHPIRPATSPTLFPVLYLCKDGSWFEDGSEVAPITMMLREQEKWFVTAGLHPIRNVMIAIEVSDEERAKLLRDHPWIEPTFDGADQGHQRQSTSIRGEC